jgi:hypothetical protein
MSDTNGNRATLQALMPLLATGNRGNGMYTGVKALMVAILEDAIVGYLGPSGRVCDEAETWCFDPRPWSPFSFTVVCHTLGLEPDAVRKVLLQLRKNRRGAREALGRLRPNVRKAHFVLDPRSLPD